MPATSDLPVAVIGAGPIGLAAAAHLMERGLTPLIFEAGSTAGSAVSGWGHIRLFSPWQYNIDAASRRLLESVGWHEPRQAALPFGSELVEHYIRPLAAVPAIADGLHTSSRVIAVSRAGMDKTRSKGRAETPFVVRVDSGQGKRSDQLVRAVIDASGTWNQPNPLGQAGLPAPGEEEARDGGMITSPLPDVTGADRERFAGRHTLVVGAGHSAANTLLSLGQLAKNVPGTRVSWAVRGGSVARLYGGGDMDGLPARGRLGSRLRALVDEGIVELHTSFRITGLKAADDLLVQGTTRQGDAALHADLLVPATGFRPDLDMLRELRLDLDPAVEAPRQLGPLIDPEFHSCGTVPPHGARVLAHPDPDFYIAGMKSYGRAPTFLLATGYEQVRSIAAAIAGNQDAADTVALSLPATGVCSTNLADDDQASAETLDRELPASANPGCCTPETATVPVGFPTGTAHGRSSDPDY